MTILIKYISEEEMIFVIAEPYFFLLSDTVFLNPLP